MIFKPSRPMHDSDGPAIAQAVYRAFKSRSKTIMFADVVKILADGYPLVTSRPLQTEDTENIFSKIYPLALPCSGLEDFPFPSRAIVDQGFSAVSCESLPDSAAQTIVKALVNHVDAVASDTNGPDLSMAPVVDGVVRHLRITQNLPPSRWATFVHVGL